MGICCKHCHAYHPWLELLIVADPPGFPTKTRSPSQSPKEFNTWRQKYMCNWSASSAVCVCIITWRQKMSGRLTGDHVHRDEVKKTISAWDCQKRQKSLAKKQELFFQAPSSHQVTVFFNKTSASLTLRCLFYLNLLESHALSMAWGRSHSAPIRPNSSQILAKHSSE